MSVAGDALVVARHVAPIWDLPPVPLRRAFDGMPELWWDKAADRLLVVSGWLDVQCLGQAGCFVGVTWGGEVLCPRFGRVLVGDVEGAAHEIVRRMPFPQEFWYFLLPPPGALAEWPGAQPLPPHTPCWEPRVGARRLFLAATTTAADWVAHRTPVHAFVDGACACPPLHL